MFWKKIGRQCSEDEQIRLFWELDSVPQHRETRAELSTAKSAPVERILNAAVSANPT